MKTSVNVRVEDLIKKVETHIADLEARKANSENESASLYEEWCKKASEALLALLTKTYNGDFDFIRTSYGDPTVRLRDVGPTPEPVNLDGAIASAKKDLSLLNLTSDETLKVNTDSPWSAYL